MRKVVILSLADGRGPRGAGDAPRVPVLACAEALRAGGAQAELVVAAGVEGIDAVVSSVGSGDSRLIVAAATDAELRAVVGRMVRHAAPPPSRRPAGLPAGRTVPDLDPIGVLPLVPAVPELASRLGLPIDPAEVAAATLAGRSRRLDLLRTDAGSVTLHGVLFAGVAASAGLWRGRVEVDDAVLTDGAEAVLACAVTNAGTSDVDGLPLVVHADPQDGLVDVAVAVPVVRRRLVGRPSVRFEVRRARGRAMSLNPSEGGVRVTDDGVAGELTHRRGWWIEPGLWGTYVS